MFVLVWGYSEKIKGWIGIGDDDDGKTDVSEDYDVKRYEQGKEAAVFMAEGDAKMDEARNIYNKMDQAESALVAKLVNGQPVDVQESVEWIRTLEGKARASLAEAGRSYDLILEMRLVDDYRDYAEMQKDLINLYGQLFTVQDEFLGSLAAATTSGQAFDAGTLMESGQLEVITGLTKAIDEATRLSEAFKLENDL